MIKRFAALVATAILTATMFFVAAPTAEAATDCAKTTVKYGTSGACVKEAQTLLKNAGFYTGSISGKASVATINAVLNFQRAQRIADNGVINATTWGRLRAPAAVDTSLPASCQAAGVVLCVSKATRTLTVLQDGAVVKTIPVRLGGFTQDKYGRYRVHQTGVGVYRVYKKDPNPYSKRYGAGIMPNSLMFDPNMYVHYSADFRAYGYTRSSHGCVNIANRADSLWVYNFTPVGSRVVVFS